MNELYSIKKLGTYCRKSKLGNTSFTKAIMTIDLVVKLNYIPKTTTLFKCIYTKH